MCVVIVDAKRYSLLVKLGVDVMCENDVVLSEEEVTMSDFMKKVERKTILPGGPICNYNGTEVPCMTTFSHGGGMTGPILTKMFRTLDSLSFFDEARKNGNRP